MKNMVAVIILLLGTSVMADTSFSIPPQYRCEVIDDAGDVYRDAHGGQVDVQTFSGLANDRMLVEAAESAMQECLNVSKNPRSCDLVSCVENPQ